MATSIQTQLDEASCILCEARAVLHALMDGTGEDQQACGVFAALARMVTLAKDVIDQTPGRLTP